MHNMSREQMVEAWEKIRVGLDGKRAEIEPILSGGLTWERIQGDARHYLAGHPDALSATTATLVRSICDIAQSGLRLGFNGEASILVFKNAAQPSPGYKGMIKLAMQSGHYASVRAAVVYSADEFDYDLGTESYLRHKPKLGGRGSVVAAYAILQPKGEHAVPALDLMDVDAINRIKARSQSGSRGKGPWSTDWDEMAKKTVTKRLLKYAPLSPDAAKLISASDEAEGFDELLDAEPGAEGEQAEPEPVDPFNPPAQTSTSQPTPAAPAPGTKLGARARKAKQDSLPIASPAPQAAPPAQAPAIVPPVAQAPAQAPTQPVPAAPAAPPPGWTEKAAAAQPVNPPVDDLDDEIQPGDAF
jgi:recombination protein RecT